MFKKLFISFILAVSALCLQAQHYQIRNYSVKEGVGQSQVFALCQDSRGYLWMGTRGGGLTRFDGLEFVHFTTRNGLANNYIYCIKTDAQGDLWIGTNVGISRFDGKQFYNYYPQGKDKPVEVLDFCFGPNNTMYLATLSGLFDFSASQFHLLTEPHVPLNTLALDKSGKIWFGNARGVFQYQPVSGRTALFLQKKYINKIICDASGKIWIGTYGSGVFLGNQNGFKPFTPARNFATQEVYEIYQDPKGNIWFGTLNQGIYRYDTLGKSFLHLGESEGLSNNHVRSIIADREGNYWFGTSGGGVCQYFGLPFTHFDRESGLKGNFIYSVFRDSKNRLWIGTGEQGVTVLDSGKFKLFGPKEGFIATKVKAIAEDTQGHIYLGTEGDGLYEYDGKDFKLLPALRGKFVRGIARDKHNQLWVATAGMGLFKLYRDEKKADKLHVKNFTTDNGLMHNRLSAIVCDAEDRIWYATENNGIGVFMDGKPLPVYPGVKGGIPLPNVRCLAIDKFGVVWAGTAGDGISRISLNAGNATLEKAVFNNQLTSLNIYLLAADAKGNIFSGSESGLDYLELDANRSLIQVKHFGKTEGFVGIETCQNSVCIDPNGSLWFGTINGLTLCNPAAFTKNPFPPAIGISAVRLYYKELSQTPYSHFTGPWGIVNELELPFDQNHLTFDLRGISLSNPTQVKFTWKLQNFDAGWSPESDQRSVTYSNIPPGEYVFLVKGKNVDGVWSEIPTRIKISIRAPYWQTWWFRLLMIVLVLGTIAIVFTIRVRNLKRKAARAEAQLRLDKKLADLEHQALRLQMNPHFIFNALNSIQSQIGEQNDQKARYYLAKFGRLMRQILDNSRKSVISLKEEIDSLENYLLVEKFSSGDTFDYEIVVPANLDTDFIKLPPMLLQPFIENSIKHGFKNLKDRRGKIELHFEEKGPLLMCKIDDNGVGRELGNRRSGSEGESYHESTALKVIKERLQLMENKTAEPIFEIIDIKTPSGEPCGTKVVVGIPMV